MKTLKRIFMLVVILSTIAGSVNIVHAKTLYDECSYLNSVLNAYLNSNGIKSDGLMISDAVPVQLLDDSDEQNIYFLKKNSVIIAKISIIKKDGQYYSCFDTDVKEFNNIYQNSSTISLVKKNNTIFALINSSAIVLYKNPYYDVTLTQSDKNFIKAIDFTFSTSLPRTVQPLGNPEVMQLTVPGVGNVKINGVGQCWAASTAMMVNYKNGTNLTATNIYNKCLNSGLVGSLGTPSGTIEWVRAAYSFYNISIYDQVGGLIYPRIYSLLSNNDPIHMDYYNTSSGSGHAVVLCGSYYDGNTLVYKYRDPNSPTEFKSVAQSLSAVTDASYLKYTDGLTLYDLCTHTYYYL